MYHIKKNIVDLAFKYDASHLNLDRWSVTICIWAVCTYEYNSAQLEVDVGDGTEELQ